ncbi:MAG: ABC transporter ATP-binding protein, partial [Marinoscillum sp.]
MNNKQIIRTIQECADLLKLKLDSRVASDLERYERNYDNTELVEFIRDLVESGTDAGVILFEKHLVDRGFRSFMNTHESPILVFDKDDELSPLIIERKGKKYKFTRIRQDEVEVTTQKNLEGLNLACTDKLEVIFLSIFDYQSLVSSNKEYTGKDTISPVYRLYKLLAAEKKDILYVYIYAALIGLLSLSLPLGIQAAIELISGGVIFSSVYVLIGLIILAVIATGVLQIFQITIVEYLQRRVFTKAAFEFAFRVPRIQMESVLNLHMPELMNRFFDVLTLQKGLPKLLIDLSTGVIQIIFGLILLSFYHPFFIFFGLVLMVILFGIFYLTGPNGLKSSIVESKYKYKVVYWLEEMARTLYSFKLSGNTNLPIKKTDLNVNNYLKNRGNHFKVLISQYSYIL